MTDITMAVGTPAAATPAAATATATSTPVDGAFTALLALALGDVPPMAVTLTDPGDGAVTTDEVDVAPPASGEAASDGADAGAPAVLLVAALGVAGAAVPVDGRPARGDAGGSDVARTSAGPPTTEGLPMSELPVVAEDVAVAAGLEVTGRLGTVTAAASARPGAASVAAGTAPGPAPEPGSVVPTAPAAGEPRPEAAQRTEVPPPTSPVAGTPVSSAGPAAPAADVSAPAAPTHPPTGGSDLHARVLGRVMDALDVLENAPPPRRLTVDLPDGDGLRLHVALRGSEVHVSVVGGGATGDLAGWTRGLSDALAARGFSLGGFSAGTGQDDRRPPTDGRQPAEDPTTARPRRRPHVVDQGLRL